jgi:hypothetical protein
MTEIEKLAGELKQKRDELAVQIELGSMEAKQQWETLEQQFNEFSAKAEIKETVAGVDQAVSSLGDELKKGYERLKKVL